MLEKYMDFPVLLNYELVKRDLSFTQFAEKLGIKYKTLNIRIAKQNFTINDLILMGNALDSTVVIQLINNLDEPFELNLEPLLNIKFNDLSQFAKATYCILNVSFVTAK